VTALPELIDSHCHLDYDYAPKGEADLVREAGLAGVSHLITIGVDLNSIDKLPPISARYPNVFHTIGFHPHEAVDFRDEDHSPRLLAAARAPKCRAVGEIGLDYHYDHSPRDVQKRVFDRMLELALEAEQPVVIHSREGEADLLEAVRRYRARLPEGREPGVIHCFTGTKEFGLACLELGFLISFSGILTFKNSETLRDCARAFPLERLMVETDSPYLAPVPHRGRKCEPAMVRATAERLAELKGVSVDEVARLTTANAKRLFRIG
jgi:TatD DNase family protein